MKMRRESLSQVLNCLNFNQLLFQNERISDSEHINNCCFVVLIIGMVISFIFYLSDHDFASSLVCTTASSQDGLEREE